MRVSVSTTEIVAGGFVLLSVLGLIAFYAIVGGYEGLTMSRLALRCAFDRGDGLAPGTSVTMNGLPIGFVESVELDPTGRVVLSLAIDRRYADGIRQSAQAASAAAESGVDAMLVDRFAAEGNSIVSLQSALVVGGSTAVAISFARAGEPVRDGEWIVARPVGDGLMGRLGELLEAGRNPRGGLLSAVLQDDGVLYDELRGLLTNLREESDVWQTSALGRLLRDEGPLYDRVDAILKGVESDLAQLNAQLAADAPLARAIQEIHYVLQGIRESGILHAVDPALPERVHELLAEMIRATAALGAVPKRLDPLTDRASDSLDDLDDILGATKRHWFLKDMFEPAADTWLRAHDTGGGR